MNKSVIRNDVIHWLEEDIKSWDNSSILVDSKDVTASIVAKQNGMISGTMVASIIFEMNEISVDFIVEEGSIVNKGDVICKISGKSNNILQVERTCLNIFSHMSGISTLTYSSIDKIRGINPDLMIAATRKTLPGLRRYQKWAVFIAGGDTHRMSLSSMIMMKENHLVNFSSITEAIQSAKKKSSFSLKIEVEVRNDDEAIEATNAGADIIMLDNYTPAMIENILPKLRSVNSKVLIEASGNINENTIVSYAKSGVDIISMGKLTHSSNVFDMSLIFDNLN